MDTQIDYQEVGGINITTIDDLTDFCRVCLQLPVESQLLDLNLIYDEDEELTYNNCFTICTNIDLTESENLPHNLCKTCGLELQMAYDFYKKVDVSKRLLKQFFEQKLDDVKQTLIVSADDSISQEASIENNQHEEEHLDIEEYHAYEALDEDAETIQIRLNTKCGEESYLIETAPRIESKLKEDFDQIEDHLDDVEKQDENWRKNNLSKQTVATMAKESHTAATVSKSKKRKATEINDEIYVLTEETSYLLSPNELKTQRTSRKRFIGQFSCDYCKKLFPNHSRMVSHRRQHEPDRPKYPCMDCGRIYATKQALEVHIRTVHTKSGYACPICNKIYAIKKCLEVHIRYHTGDFPFVCDLCGKKFAQMSNLNTHKNIKHNSLRFGCEHPNCGKFFTSSASLRNHEFTHGIMPFECEFCGKGYPAKSKLKVHIRRKHGHEMTLDQLEGMRRFHVMRSKLNLIKVEAVED